MNDSSVLLNDDLLVLILRRLPLKELVCLQPVSQQFQSCIEYILKNWPELGFGSIEKYWYIYDFNLQYLHSIDITPALRHYSKVDLSFYDRRSPFESLLDRHSNVRTIHLNELCINFETIKVITDRCKHLEGLNLTNVSIREVDEKSPKEWAKVLANIKHMKIVVMRLDPISQPNVKLLVNILQELYSLESLQLESEDRLNLENTSHLVKFLPPNIRRLNIQNQNLDKNSLGIIIKKCFKITHLTINNNMLTPDDELNQMFEMVCNHLHHLQSLTISLRDISSKDFAQNIEKLRKLRHLSINGWNMTFDMNDMRPHFKHPIIWRSLSLYCVKCSPEMLSNLPQMLPEVRRMTVRGIRTGSPHNHHQFMQYLSKLPQLRRLTIGQNDYALSLRTLKLFVGLSVLNVYMNGLSNLIHFVTRSLKNTKCFHLNLRPSLASRLTHEMTRQNKRLPDNVIIGYIKHRY